MFELKQKILAVIQDLFRMAHRIGKQSVSDLLVRRAQVPLENVTVETRAQNTTRDWGASKQKCNDYFHFYTVQELRYKSKTANYLHPFLLFLDIQF